MKILNDIKPALGAITVGILGMFFIKYGIMGVGYGGVKLAIDGQIALHLLLVLGVLKLLATSSTIGSGGSAGIFAPTLYMGAMLGAFIGASAGGLFPASINQTTFAVVGMATMFAGAAQAPFASAILVSEIAGNYPLILLLIIPCLASYFSSRFLLGDGTIYTRRPLKHGIHIHPLNIPEELRVFHGIHFSKRG